MGLQYHAGQVQVQEEANTRRVAEMLADWVGPVGEFAQVADLFFLATAGPDGALHFASVSGKAPLVEMAAPGMIRLPAIEGLPEGGAQAGGLAISLAQLRRARINGFLRPDGSACVLEATEAFTNCRKYVMPSVALADEQRCGPSQGYELALDSPWLADVIERAVTSFLASVSPDGQPDVSHRGGDAGFLRFDPARGTLSWSEYVGDGMFKSAGNIRATGIATLLVLDLDSGDAAELTGTAVYNTLRTAKQARTDALERHSEQYPVQGAMSLQIQRATRLESLIGSRRRIEKALRVTSASSIDEQAPQ
jgi:hypothetical protein